MALSSNNPYSTQPHPTPTPAPAPAPAGSNAHGEPAEPPPAYADATSAGGAGAQADHLQVPSSPRRASSEYTASDDGYGEDGIDPEARRSMEADQRELPKGWSREFDGASQHIFYVDTTSNPPRSIWVHPYDDPEYVNSLPKDHPLRANRDAPPAAGGAGPSSHAGPSSSAASSSSSQPEGKRTFGRKLKDKLTGSTHEERVQQRKRQAEEERKAYQQYLDRRKALLEAQRDGRYQQRFAAPSAPYSYGGYGGGAFGGGYPGGYGYGPRAYGTGMATSGDIYRTDPYGRYNRGYGYGGRGNGLGMGPGMGMGLGAGMLGGLLVGDLLF